MGMFDSIKNKVKDWAADKSDKAILVDGSFSDRRDVNDPTGKFSSSRFVRVNYPSTLKKNVIFHKPEFDLPTIANAVEMDGILQRCVTVYEEQILKNGIDFISRDDKAQIHVDRRLREIDILTGISFFETLSKVVRQLVIYGNAYIIKVRSNNKSRFGKEYELYGKKMNPIVGLFVADATTMEIGINNKGHIVNYKQKIRGEENVWDEKDIIHFTYHKTPGTLTGMSSIVPVLDDVRALRKLEEEVEILGFQYSIPLYLYKVGTKDMPPAPGEIENVSATVNSMPAYGMLVVPGHHTIEVPTNNNTPVDILSFVTHFKKRIYSGLGVSPIAMGEVDSANRNTAESLDLAMQTGTIGYQRILKSKLEMELLREIILDGKFDDNGTDIEVRFPEIDLEHQIKKETHIIQKFINNLITREEARNEMDYDTDFDEKNTYLHLITLEVEKEKINKTDKSIDTKVRPSNQHGKSSGRPKIKKDFIDSLLVINNKIYDNLICDGFSQINKDSYISKLNTNLKDNLKKQMDYTINELNDIYHLDYSINNKLFDTYIEHINVILYNKFIVFNKNLDNNIYQNLLKDEINRFIDTQDIKIDSLAKASIYKDMGYKTILVNADSCDIHNNSNILIDTIKYKQLPPFKHNCKCIIDEKGLYEFTK